MNRLRIGFMPLSDCAVLAVAVEKGVLSPARRRGDAVARGRGTRGSIEMGSDLFFDGSEFDATDVAFSL